MRKNYIGISESRFLTSYTFVKAHTVIEKSPVEDILRIKLNVTTIGLFNADKFAKSLKNMMQNY